MSNLFIGNNENTEEILLTQFETAQGWRVKIDLRTNDIYASKRDLEALAELSKGRIQRDFDGAADLGAYLRFLDLSGTHKELKLITGGSAHCFNESQIVAMLKFYDCPVYKASAFFGFKTAILHSCGLLEKPQQPQLTPSQAIELMMPSFKLAEQNPGIAELAAKVNTIPCLILHEKPFTLRFWTQIHFPGYGLSRQALTRFGRQVSATYQQLKLVLPTNGYTPSANKYTRVDHELLCQVFQTMLDQGQLES
jgi:hypothetical protein